MGIFYQKRQNFTVTLAFPRLLLLKTEWVCDCCDTLAPSAGQSADKALPGQRCQRNCSELLQSVEECVRIYLPLSFWLGICCSLRSKYMWAEEKNNTMKHQITKYFPETGAFVFRLIPSYFFPY